MITRRRALKARVCTYNCGSWIKSGSVYLRHSRREGSHKAGWKWTMLNECSQCATSHGRAGLLEQK